MLTINGRTILHFHDFDSKAIGVKEKQIPVTNVTYNSPKNIFTSVIF